MRKSALGGRLKSAWAGAIVGLATCFYLTYIPMNWVRLIPKWGPLKNVSQQRWTGAGTVGSFFGAIVFWTFPPFVRESIWILIWGFLGSVFLAHFTEKILSSPDDSRITVDEVAGMWVALWGLPSEWGWHFVVAFFLFRVFDVWKGPLGHALEKVPGGWGITLDDIYAGILANMGARLFLYLRL